MPQLDVQYYATQIFWFCIFFAATYAFNVLVLLPFLRSKQQARLALIEHNIKIAESLFEESKKMKSEITSMLRKVQDQAQQIRTDAANQAQAMIQQQLKLSGDAFRQYLTDASTIQEAHISRITNELPRIVEDMKGELLEIFLTEINLYRPKDSSKAENFHITHRKRKGNDGNGSGEGSRL